MRLMVVEYVDLQEHHTYCGLLFEFFLAFLSASSARLSHLLAIYTSLQKQQQFSSSWGPNWGPPLKLPIHHSTVVMRGLRAALNWDPIMPGTASLSGSYGLVRCCFPAGFGYYTALWIDRVKAMSQGGWHTLVPDESRSTLPTFIIVILFIYWHFKPFRFHFDLEYHILSLCFSWFSDMIYDIVSDFFYQFRSTSLERVCP